MESKRTATTYFIPPGKFLLMENALGNPDLIQSSVSGDCRVTIVDKANFPLDELEQWPTFRLTATEIKLNLGDGPYHIYIVVPVPGNTESTTASLAYHTALVDRDGYELLESVDEEGNPVTVRGSLLGKEGYKYYVCGKVSEKGGNPTANTTPAGMGRAIEMDLGVTPAPSTLPGDLSDYDEIFEIDKVDSSNPKSWLLTILATVKEMTARVIRITGSLIFGDGDNQRAVTDVAVAADKDNKEKINDTTLASTAWVNAHVEGLDDKYLRKDQDDKTPHSLGVGKDLSVDGKTTAKGGIQIGPEFLSGLFGYGANIDEAGQAELHSLFIRTFLEVPELRYNRVTVRMGDEINSVSAGLVESVNPLSETSGTLVLKLEDGEFGTLEKHDIVMQIFSDMSKNGAENNSSVTSDDGRGNRYMKGFATVMFEVTDVTGERNEVIQYSLRPLSERWKKQIHPFPFGPFVQRGNFENPERQVVIYQGLCPKPYTRYMFGVNDWEFTAKMIGMQLGDLSNLSVFGMDMSGYSAYLNNVYFTGMIRQLYIPQWMEGESAAQNGTLVYMGGDHYVAKGDTTNPPLFDLTDEDGNSLLFSDEEGNEGNILDLNNEEYDQLAKKGEDGVGIKSNVSYYMITASSLKPLESSGEWGSSMVQPTELKPYLWKKTVVTYTNLTAQTTVECISVRGKDGTSVNIDDSFDSESELLAQYPNGPVNPSDAYIVGGDLYVWTGSKWKNVGQIRGEKGDTAYVHIKYANQTASGTQVTVGGSVVTLSFTSNDGEDMGDWMGIYSDFTQADSMNIAAYKWKNIKGSKGDDSTSYWLDSPVGSINFTSDGYPNPASFVVTMKKKTGNGDVVACADYYLATWKYDGNWQIASVSSTKTSSVIIMPAASTAYKQYMVTAHTTGNVSSIADAVKEIGIGVSFDGMKGKDGADGKDGEDGKDGKDGKDGEEGLYVYDAGLYSSTRAYHYKKMSDGKVRRDKIVYEIGGSFYNFLVRSRQSDDSTGLVNTPPTSSAGDANWEVMSQFQSIIANTLFGTNANIGGFMTSAEKMISQTEVTGSDGTARPTLELNGKDGTMTMRQSGGTTWQVASDGVQSVGNANGERIEINPNTRSVSSYDKEGGERTVIDGSEYTADELVDVQGVTVQLNSSAQQTDGYAVTGYGMSPVEGSVVVSDRFYTSAGVLDVSVSSMRVDVLYPVIRATDTSDEIQMIPYGEVKLYVETYETASSLVPVSRKVVASVSAYGEYGNTVSSQDYLVRPSVPLGKGYHRLVMVVAVQGANETLGARATGRWVITGVAVSSESYVSRHFANGMFLSCSTSEYFMAMAENGRMNVQVASGGNVYSIRDGVMKINGIRQPVTVYAARVTDTSESASVAPSKLELVNNGDAATLTKGSSVGVYTLSMPLSYGLAPENMIVNLTGYGSAAGESSDIKATLQGYRVYTTSLALTIHTSDNETRNYGGFIIEIKKVI